MSFDQFLSILRARKCVALVVLLGVVGLSALTGWLDVVLLPALAVFAALTVYAVWRRRRRMKTT